MCGIVGYVGGSNATPLVFDGLKRLEYRGYDSAGIAVIDTSGCIAIRRDVGKLDALERLLREQPIAGSIGIGHTRWATHGKPSQRNAHPHLSMDGTYVVVHNGIVENYHELREELRAQGVEFQSETDTEVIVHLIAHLAAEGLDVTEATRRACLRLQGAHAIAVLSAKEPDRLVAVRIGNAGGLTIGMGEGENYIASDLPAILDHTRRVIFLESRQMVTLTRSDVHIQTLTGTAVHPTLQVVPWDAVSAERGEYRHFMQKEIFEQGRALTDTLRDRIDFETGEVHLPHLSLSANEAHSLTRVVTVACGTSAHAGL